MKIKGITVVLYEKTLTGFDDFNCEVWEDVPVSVDNVLVTPIESNDIVNNYELNGRTAKYQLAIPKGDTHNWEDVRVDFFGTSFRTMGKPIKGIEENIPLAWNTKVYADYYE